MYNARAVLPIFHIRNGLYNECLLKSLDKVKSIGYTRGKDVEYIFE